MSKQVLGNDLILGQIAGTGKSLTLSAEERERHLYCCGATRSGKSKFLENLLQQDIFSWTRNKCGLMLLDYHGNLYDDLMKWLTDRDFSYRPIVPIDLRQDKWVISYNMLMNRPLASPSVVINEIVRAIAYVFDQPGTTQTPRFAEVATYVFTVLYEKGYTLLDATHLLDRVVKDVREAMTAGIQNEDVRSGWEYLKSLNRKDFNEEVSSSFRRLIPFITNERLRYIFGQPDVSIDFTKALKEGWIILVNLSTELRKISEESARLFGTVLLNDLWGAARERGKGNNKPFYVYIDEAQEFVTPTMAKALAQLSGFGLHFTLANQFPKQFINASAQFGKSLYDEIRVNAQNKVAFHIRGGEEHLLPIAEDLFEGTFNPDETKHVLYSNEVAEYKLEYHKAYSHSRTESFGETSSEGHGEGEGESGNADNPEVAAWNAYFSDTYGSGATHAVANTEGESLAPMLRPVLQKKISSIQYRSLDEQLHRAMAVLYDQEQRQFVCRKSGSDAPVSVFTPFIEDKFVNSGRIERYTTELLKHWNFAKPLALVQKEMEERKISFGKKCAEEAFSEPKTSKGKV